MKRTIKRLLIGISLTTTVLTGFLVIILLYPQNLFAKRLSYRQFSVYSNIQVPDHFRGILDNSLALVEYSELYDKSYRFDIFCTSNSLFNKVDNLVLGASLAKSIDNNIVLKVKVDFERDILIGSKNQRNLTRTIAHEMIHCLQLSKYGFRKFNPWSHVELWKLEGYPEYISRQKELRSKEYSLKNEIKRLIDFEGTKNNGWFEISKDEYDLVVYFRGRLMIEYLMNVKGLTYDRILKDDVIANNVYSEMTSWSKYEK